MSILYKVGKLSQPSFWRQLPWRVRTALDRSGLAESRLATEVNWIRRPPREPTIFTADGLRPLRILTVVMRHDYGSFRRGLSYEDTHLVGTLRDWGYEVVEFDFAGIAHRHGNREMNRMLREAAVRVRPDLAFFVLFRDEIEPSTLEHIRDAGIPTFNWFCDDHWRYEDFSRPWAPRFDLVSTTSSDAYEKYRSDGITNVLKTQWAFNPYLFPRRRVPQSDRPLDVVFVGQPHGNRREVVETLRRSGVDVVTRGHGWPEGRILYTEMLQLFGRAKVVLGLAGDWEGKTLQVKGRDFEVPPAGGFYLTAKNPELSPYFKDDQEIVTYTSMDDLLHLCSTYLKDDEERDRIAASGFDRAWNDHTFVHRFSEIFSACGFTSAEVSSLA
jgi:spore maturation protein CgeB